MRRKPDFITRTVISVVFAFAFYILIVYIGVQLGVQENQRMTLVVGGLFASFLFAVFTWKTSLSLIGIVFFIVLWAGDFAKLAPGETLFISVVACLATAFFIVIAQAFRD